MLAEERRRIHRAFDGLEQIAKKLGLSVAGGQDCDLDHYFGFGWDIFEHARYRNDYGKRNQLDLILQHFLFLGFIACLLSHLPVSSLLLLL